MGLQIPSLSAQLCVLNVCVTSELLLHRYGGSWASSFTSILQEQMDERVWQHRTLCTAAAAAQRNCIYLLRAHEHQVGVVGVATAHPHNTTTS